MTDWETLKVVDLKEELKSRGIPLTGLKLKQQFIDKLNEIEAVSEKENEGETVSQDNETDQDAVKAISEGGSQNAETFGTQPQLAVEIPEKTSESKSTSTTPKSASVIKTEGVRDQQLSASASNEEHEGSDESNPVGIPANGATGEDRIDHLPDELPAELKKEESHARDENTPPPVEARTVEEQKSIQKVDPFIPQEASKSVELENLSAENPETKDAAELESHRQQSSDESSDAKEESRSMTEAPSSTRVPTPEILDDRRKRKRRSETPVPESQDIAQKKAKTNGGSSIPTRRESDALKKVQDATDAAQAIRNPELVRDHTDTDTMTEDGNKNQSQASEAKGHESHLPEWQQQSESSPRPTSILSERDISPAIHPATRSLYIRNFKRPLHIPTLRSHIASLVGPSDQDPLRVFYLDSIRTHAFVSFQTISAASRVRNAMHGTRFPDESMRELLWVDYIPDERVQEWIDQETGSGSSGGGFGGGRGSSKKYEVIYIDSRNGVEAILQEASANQFQRPGGQQSRSNRTVPQEPTASAAIASNVHSSRAPLHHHSPPVSQSHHPSSGKPGRPSDPGKGFRALDELFSSTAAKPKLYYKLPNQAVVDDRLNMIRVLRVKHEQMGKSGDEGMKRYSFEKQAASGREEWVDKGPEFGFGRRGQERLTGFGNSYSAGRGRGGGFRGGSRRGGDSWRGR